MTEKEYILDSLINDDEAFTQILEYFEFVNVAISRENLEKLLDEMVKDGYITINKTWRNEKDEYPYSLTEKGEKTWSAIEEFQ